ncbi:MAG TPA: YggT family protein [Candidatus Bathyarchaeia archaeon]|nr:YggT family protein [Candidatus Bathyarchaeia archaeon]
MFILSNFLMALSNAVGVVLNIVWLLILIRAVISWVSPDPYNPIVQALYQLTEPILEPIRRLLPRFSAFDFSPIIAFVLIIFLQSFLVQTLIDLAHWVR